MALVEPERLCRQRPERVKSRRADPPQGNMRLDHTDSRPRADNSIHQGPLDRPTRARRVGALTRTALRAMSGLRSMTTPGQRSQSGHLSACDLFTVRLTLFEQSVN